MTHDSMARKYEPRQVPKGGNVATSAIVCILNLLAASARMLDSPKVWSTSITPEKSR